MSLGDEELYEQVTREERVDYYSETITREEAMQLCQAAWTAGFEYLPDPDEEPEGPIGGFPWECPECGWEEY